MKINLKVRIKNKIFWITFISAMLVLIKSVVNLFGLTIDFGNIENNLIEVVESVFLVLGVVGIIVDPTTSGIGDSENALTYNTPNK